MNNEMNPGHRHILHDSSHGEFRIIVAEDDEVIRRILEMSLKRDGYTVESAPNGMEALRLFHKEPSDLVILDVNMPEMNGYDVCLELRKRTDVPIIIVTTKSHTDDIVAGYKLGADIYITKPFSPKELLARIRALLRRITHHHNEQQDIVLRAGDIVLNEDTHEVAVAGELTNLSPNEYDLLRYFMHNSNAPVTKETLLETIWGYSGQDDANLVRVTIRRLRSKIEKDPSEPVYLQTVRGIGYMFVKEQRENDRKMASQPVRVS